MTTTSGPRKPPSATAALLLAYIAVPPLLLGAFLTRQPHGPSSNLKVRKRNASGFGGVAGVSEFVVNASFAIGAAGLILGTGAAFLLSQFLSVSPTAAMAWASPGGILLCHALGWYVGEWLTSRSLSRQIISETSHYWPSAVLHGGIGWILFAMIVWFA